MDLTARLSGLGAALVQQCILCPQELEELLQQAEAASLTFAEQLVCSGRLLAGEVAEFAARFFGYPFCDLSSVDIATLPQCVVLQYDWLVSWRVIPLSLQGNRLVIGASDPTLTSAFDAVRLMTGFAVEVHVVEEDKLANVFQGIRSGQKGGWRVGTVNQLALQDNGNAVLMPDFTSEVDDAPVMLLLSQVFQYAVRVNASDIHFEPYDAQYRIRCRVDGKLRTVIEPISSLKDNVATCIKVMARLDIAEKRLPQDGRLKWGLSAERTVDCRVSTLPTLFGEKIVLRILNEVTVPLVIDALGFEASQQTVLQRALSRPWGMILVTGPTGSGKTISLYSCLSVLNNASVNIATVEDPVEVILPGITQVNVNEKAGLSFAVALRAFLRQDPDVLMVGEIRDAETADIAIKASETGHLVLATLHTNDAPSAVARLLNLGVAPFNVAECVVLVIAQRLVRRLCVQCCQPQQCSVVVDDTLERITDSWEAKKPVGCVACHGSGYQGRVGVFEVMPITGAMSQLIMQGGKTPDIARLARDEGMIDLRCAGLIKVQQGLTSLSEVCSMLGGEQSVFREKFS